MSDGFILLNWFSVIKIVRKIHRKRHYFKLAGVKAWEVGVISVQNVAPPLRYNATISFPIGGHYNVLSFRA